MADRNIADVIESLKEVLPAELVVAHAKLDRLLSSTGYTPPEYSGRDWAQLSAIVEEVVGAPPLTELWQVQLVARLMALSETQVRTRFGYRPA